MVFSTDFSIEEKLPKQNKKTLKYLIMQLHFAYELTQALLRCECNRKGCPLTTFLFPITQPTEKSSSCSIYFCKKFWKSLIFFPLQEFFISRLFIRVLYCLKKCQLFLPLGVIRASCLNENERICGAINVLASWVNLFLTLYGLWETEYC